MIKIKKEAVLVSPKDIAPSSKELEVLGTFNPGAMRLPNRDILLYVRVAEKLIKDEDKKYYYSPRFVGEEKFKIKLDKFSKKEVLEKSDIAFEFKDETKRLTYISYFKRVFLDKTGFKVKLIEQKPSFFGLKWDGELGVEDARITKIGDIYVMTYVTLSRKENVSTSYAISNDGINWYRRGIIFREQNKDVVIFPELINNKYVAYDRPEGSFRFSMPHIWVSYSNDLQFWGQPKALVLSKRGEWDSGRVGAGCPPIKTKNGWLLIYHGVTEKVKMNWRDKIIHGIGLLLGKEVEPLEREIFYCAGAALFNLKNPRKLIAKSKEPIIMPRKKYERSFEKEKKVFFPTGAVLDEDGKHLLLFSGGGDTVVTVKKIKLSEIFKKLEKV